MASQGHHVSSPFPQPGRWKFIQGLSYSGEQKNLNNMEHNSGQRAEVLQGLWRVGTWTCKHSSLFLLFPPASLHSSSQLAEACPSAPTQHCSQAWGSVAQKYMGCSGVAGVPSNQMPLEFVWLYTENSFKITLMCTLHRAHWPCGLIAVALCCPKAAKVLLEHSWQQQWWVSLQCRASKP